MDQIKIGKFISERRKEQKLTQAQLAEMLGITDRAVSKWETGNAMPDSSIMLQLCEILKITVTDLLSGEKINMDNYNGEMEKTMLEMVRQKEENDKMLLRLEVVIGVLSTVIILVPTIIAALLPMEDWQRILIAFSGFIPAFIGFFFTLKLEQIAGYYECAHCHNRYVPTYKDVYRSMHMGRTRYMNCPKCGKKSWQKKKIKK